MVYIITCYDKFGICDIYYRNEIEEVKKIIENLINTYKEIKITNIEYGKEKNNK